MTFGHPHWLWAFALLPLFAALFLRNEQLRARLLRKLIAARLEKQLAGNISVARRRLRFLLVLAGLACVILSLAQPRWGYTWEEQKVHGRDIIIAIDVSKSMLADDVQPSRLARAKLAAEDLITQVAGDRVGLVAFAGTAFLQAPLTADHGAVLEALRELDTDIIPRGGTNIADAIRTAVDAFGKGESDNRALVLFTDGEELEEDGARIARDLNGAVRIFTIGLGSPGGSMIAVTKGGQTEFVKDPEGQIVKSRLDEPRLQEIAQAGKGFYVHLTNGVRDMQQVVQQGLRPMTEKDINSERERRPLERYQWPLSAGLTLLAASLLVGERRRSARLSAPAPAAAALLLFFGFAALASAKNPGLDAYDREDYRGAQDSFDKQLKDRPQSPELQFDLGSAAYKNGEYDRALENFGKALTTTDPALREKAEYNLGNTLVQRGLKQKDKPAALQELRNALQHYDAALQAQPQDGNAKYNRGVVQQIITELEKEPPKQDQKNQDKKDQDKDKDQKQSQQNQSQQSQSKDQQQKQDQDQQSQQQQSQQQQSQQQQGQQSQAQQGNQQKDDGSKQQQAQAGEKKDQQQAEGKEQQAAKQQAGSEDKDGEKKDVLKQDQASKDEPNKDQQKQDGQQAQQAQPEPKKDENGQQGQSAEQKAAEMKEAQQPADAAEQQAQHKLTGELKDKGQPPEENAKAEQEAAEEAQAAAENRMTESQARNLLDSLKSDDAHVRLLKPGEKSRPPGSFRDW